MLSFLRSPRRAGRPGSPPPPRSPAARSPAARSAAWRPAREQEPGGCCHFYEALDVPGDPADRRAFLKTAAGAGAVAAAGLAAPAISQRASARALRFVPDGDLANFDP